MSQPDSERRLVVHCKRDRYDVYIGRPSKWGNPFTHLDIPTRADFKVSDRDAAIQAYREYLNRHPELIAQAKRELRGKVLGCWCAPKSCHGDILTEVANA